MISRVRIWSFRVYWSSSALGNVFSVSKLISSRSVCTGMVPWVFQLSSCSKCSVIVGSVLLFPSPSRKWWTGFGCVLVFPVVVLVVFCAGKGNLAFDIPGFSRRRTSMCALVYGLVPCSSLYRSFASSLRVIPGNAVTFFPESLFWSMRRSRAKWWHLTRFEAQPNELMDLLHERDFREAKYHWSGLIDVSGNPS